MSANAWRCRKPLARFLTIRLITFGNGVGHSVGDEGKDASLVTACGGDEPAQGFEAAAQGRGSPALEESHCGPGCAEVPELLELVLQSPRTIDTAVVFLKCLEGLGVTTRTVRGMPVQEPAQPLEGLSLCGTGFSPLCLSNLVDGLVERLDHVESVQYQSSIGAVSTDGAHVRLAHVAAAGVNL